MLSTGSVSDEQTMLADFEKIFLKKTGKTIKVIAISTLDLVLRKMTVGEILDTVDSFRLPGMPPLRNACRKRELVNLRKIFCLLAKQAGYSLATIGDELGERDHTTVLYNVRAAKIHLEREKDFRDLCYEIQSKILQLYESRLSHRPTAGTDTKSTIPAVLSTI